MLADLQGQIERITYANDENGYTVAKLKVYGQRDLVTIVGNLMAPTPGEIIKMKGEWSNHPKYGEQFKIVHYKTTVPASALNSEFLSKPNFSAILSAVMKPIPKISVASR